MRSKKGLTEADWAISMGIFLIYLAWFFLVIRPTFLPETKESLPFGQLKEAFFGIASVDMNRTPLIIRSNVTGLYEPVIADFPFSEDPPHYYMGDTYFSIDEGKLFLITRLSSAPYSNTKLVYLYHSTSNYTMPPISSDLVSSEESTSTSDFTAKFDGSLLQDAYFKNRLKIREYSIAVDGKQIDTTKSSHYYNKILSKHKIITPELNHSTYIFLNNPRLYNLLKSTKTKNVMISAELDSYPRFYISPSIGGTLNYNQTGCASYTTDFVDFFDSVDGVAFVFDDDVDLEICHEGVLAVTASFDFSREAEYQIIFHDIQADATRFIEPYALIWGEDESIAGLSDEKLFSLKNKNYTYINSLLGYDYSFEIIITNSTKNTIYTFGKEPPQRVTAGGRTYNTAIIDRYGNQSQASVTFVSW